MRFYYFAISHLSTDVNTEQQTVKSVISSFETAAEMVLLWQKIILGYFWWQTSVKPILEALVHIAWVFLGLYSGLGCHLLFTLYWGGLWLASKQGGGGEGTAKGEVRFHSRT